MPFSSMITMASGTVARIERRCSSVPVLTSALESTGWSMTLPYQPAEQARQQWRQRILAIRKGKVAPSGSATEIRCPRRKGCASSSRMRAGLPLQSMAQSSPSGEICRLHRDPSTSTPPNRSPVRLLNECSFIHLVSVVERKPDQIAAAHRAAREFRGAVKFQANSLPIIHGDKMRKIWALSHTQSYAYQLSARGRCVLRASSTEARTRDQA